jgi:hypothetical protein
MDFVLSIDNELVVEPLIIIHGNRFKDLIFEAFVDQYLNLKCNK